MPVFLRLFASERAMRWIFDFQVDLETPAGLDLPWPPRQGSRHRSIATDLSRLAGWLSP